jgi:hypothetical protein
LIEFTRGLSQIAAFSSVETRDTNGPKAPPDKHGSASSPDSSVLGSSVPDPTAPQESSAPDAVTQPAPLFASAATPYRPRDISAAIAELDQAMQLDPKFSAAYIDRNIIFFRRQKLAHALASIHPTRHIERMSRAEPAPIRAKAHFIGFRAMSVSPRRMAQQDAPRGYLNTYSAEQDWNASRKARGNVREGP